MGRASSEIGPGRRSNSVHKGTGHGVMWGHPSKVSHWGDFPDGGGYPHGFVEWAYREMASVTGRCVDPTRVLHLCSGSMRTGVRIDIRPSTRPDLVADCRRVPLTDATFDHVLADPPYSPEWAENLYGTGSSYPKPAQILREATRLLRPGGAVGILHTQVPTFRRPLRLHRVYAIHRGLGFSLVAFSLLVRGDD